MRTENLPRILSTDPASVSIGAKPGQVIKILRKSPTAKYTVAYRLVVESENMGEVSSFAEPSEEFTVSSEEI